MMALDLQLLLGLLLYFVAQPQHEGDPRQLRRRDEGSGAAVLGGRTHRDDVRRAIALAHVGRVLARKAPTPSAKRTRLLICFGLATVLIILGMPWPGRPGGRVRSSEVYDSATSCRSGSRQWAAEVGSLSWLARGAGRRDHRSVDSALRLRLRQRRRRRRGGRGLLRLRHRRADRDVRRGDDRLARRAAIAVCSAASPAAACRRAPSRWSDATAWSRTTSIPTLGTGRVNVGGEDWAARSAEPIPTGTKIRVVGADGIVLEVTRA